MIVRPAIRYTAIGLLAGLATLVARAAGAPPAFAACAACHSEAPGAPGPSLKGVVGRKAGSAEGFRYSPAMKRSTVVWSNESLDAYLADTQKVVPGNVMAFPGVSDAKQRSEIVAYIAALK